MQRHITIAGALYALLGALSLLAAALLFFGVEIIPGATVHTSTGNLAAVMSLLFLIAAALALTAGIGLLQRKRWARKFALGVAILGLLFFPVGTALGAYTIWVLLHDESVRRFAT